MVDGGWKVEIRVGLQVLIYRAFLAGLPATHIPPHLFSSSLSEIFPSTWNLEFWAGFACCELLAPHMATLSARGQPASTDSGPFLPHATFPIPSIHLSFHIASSLPKLSLLYHLREAGPHFGGSEERKLRSRRLG